MRLSSQLTLLSKVAIILIGLPISAVIAVETQYAIWGIAISLLLMAFCVFFAIKTADLYKENDNLIFQKPMQGKVTVASHEVSKVKLFKSKKHTYLWFETAKGSFLVIAPMWGEERAALLKIHEGHQSNLGKLKVVG